MKSLIFLKKSTFYKNMLTVNEILLYIPLYYLTKVIKKGYFYSILIKYFNV